MINFITGNNKIISLEVPILPESNHLASQHDFPVSPHLSENVELHEVVDSDEIQQKSSVYGKTLIDDKSPNKDMLNFILEDSELITELENALATFRENSK